jgi:hypothetical protein
MMMRHNRHRCAECDRPVALVHSIIEAKWDHHIEQLEDTLNLALKLKERGR